MDRGKEGEAEGKPEKEAKQKEAQGKRTAPGRNKRPLVKWPSLTPCILLPEAGWPSDRWSVACGLCEVGFLQGARTEGQRGHCCLPSWGEVRREQEPLGRACCECLTPGPGATV